MNWIYHIDLETTDRVDNQTYAERLKSGEWFATPTLAREAYDKAIAEIERYEQQKVDEIDEVKPAKPRKVKANGNRKPAD